MTEQDRTQWEADFYAKLPTLFPIVIEGELRFDGWNPDGSEWLLNGQPLNAIMASVCPPESDEAYALGPVRITIGRLDVKAESESDGT